MITVIIGVLSRGSNTGIHCDFVVSLLSFSIEKSLSTTFLSVSVVVYVDVPFFSCLDVACIMYVCVVQPLFFVESSYTDLVANFSCPNNELIRCPPHSLPTRTSNNPISAPATKVKDRVRQATPTNLALLV